MSRFIVHNPNNEEETMRIASLLFMASNLSYAVDVVNRVLLSDKDLSDKEKNE